MNADLKKLFQGKNALILTAVSVSSWFCGYWFEKRRQESIKVVGTKETNKNYPVNSETQNLVATRNKIDYKVLEVQERTAQIMKYGFPSLSGDIRSYDDFVIAYDRRNKIPHWVFEHLTAKRLAISDNVDRSMCEFKPDLSIHEYFRATNEDYKGSGYDRGHLAAAANHKLAQHHCDQTFFLSNISPQVGRGFNRDAWNQLEKYVRSLTKKYPNVYVCTGPLFLPRLEPDGKKYIKYEVIGNNEVAVPTHFFKIILMETDKNKLHLETYMLPNKAIDPNEDILQKYKVNPGIIERYAGILFFYTLKDKLESVNGKYVSLLKILN